MSHSVRLVIGRPGDVARFVGVWPQTHAVDLEAGWAAAPVTDELYDAIAANARSPDANPAFDLAPPGLDEAMAAITNGGGGLAYVETEYFGGSGDQSGGAWIGGESRCAERGHGSINTALHAIGVTDAAGKDAFDTLGLGRRRSMNDYAPARAPATGAGSGQARPAGGPAAGLPLWLVVGVIAAAIGLGLAAGLIA